MKKNFLNNFALRRVKTAQAAGTTDVESDIVDMQGYDSVAFVSLFGAITAGAVTSMKVQQNSANQSSGMTDLTGASVTVNDDDDNKLAAIEVYKPSKRYVRTVIDRGTQNAVVDGVLAILFNADEVPVTQPDDVLGQALVFTPAESS